MKSKSLVKSLKKYLSIAASQIRYLPQDQLSFTDEEKNFLEIWSSVKSVICELIKNKMRGDIIKQLVKCFDGKSVEFFTDFKNFYSIIPFFLSVREISKDVFKNPEDQIIINFICDYLHDFFNVEYFSQSYPKYIIVLKIIEQLAEPNSEDFNYWYNLFNSYSRCNNILIYTFYQILTAVLFSNDCGQKFKINEPNSKNKIVRFLFDFQLHKYQFYLPLVGFVTLPYFLQKYMFESGDYVDDKKITYDFFVWGFPQSEKIKKSEISFAALCRAMSGSPMDCEHKEAASTNEYKMFKEFANYLKELGIDNPCIANSNFDKITKLSYLKAIRLLYYFRHIPEENKNVIEHKSFDVIDMIEKNSLENFVFERYPYKTENGYENTIVQSLLKMEVPFNLTIKLHSLNYDIFTLSNELISLYFKYYFNNTFPIGFMLLNTELPMGEKYNYATEKILSIIYFKYSKSVIECYKNIFDYILNSKETFYCHYLKFNVKSLTIFKKRIDLSDINGSLIISLIDEYLGEKIDCQRAQVLTKRILKILRLIRPLKQDATLEVIIAIYLMIDKANNNQYPDAEFPRFYHGESRKNNSVKSIVEFRKPQFFTSVFLSILHMSEILLYKSPIGFSKSDVLTNFYNFIRTCDLAFDCCLKIIEKYGNNYLEGLKAVQETLEKNVAHMSILSNKDISIQ